MMTPLRFVLLLAVVSTAVITGTSATRHYNIGPTWRSHTGKNESVISRYNTASCLPQYEQMIQKEPKAVISIIEKPHSLCVSPNGNFVVASYVHHGKFFIFNSCGFIIKRVMLPTGAALITDCAFTKNAIYLTDFGMKKIYKYDPTGIFQYVLAFGYRFKRIAARHNRVYTTTQESKMILAYDSSTGREAARFHTTIGNAQAIAFDKHDHLHVSSRSKTIEVFNMGGKKLSQRTYIELNVGDGLFLDDHDNTIVTDRTAPQKVLIYRPNNTLMKKLQEYDSPTGVAVGKDCSLYVADFGAGKVYIY